jgi:Zn-dependent peptidase ImmA (M78 family)/transcriptional regulator with XRE-family HTH domain
MNPEMLLLARELRGYTQGELADLTGIGQHLISKYEAGLAAPNEETLIALASTLKLPIRFFELDDVRLKPASLHVMYRRRYATPVGVLKGLTAESNFTRIHIHHLLESPDFRKREFPRYLDRKARPSIEKCAEILRSFLQIPHGPILNLVDRIERGGGFIIDTLINTPKVDAFILGATTGQPIIFVNGETDGDRRRFSIAHELGHHVLHDFIDDQAETEADAFAAALLMPRNEIYHDLQSPLTTTRLIALKVKWKVSIAALIFRAHDLGILTDKQYTSMFKRLSKLGWRKKEPVEIPREEPHHLRSIFSHYISTRGYSTKRLAAMILCDEEEMNERYRPYFDAGALRQQLKIVLPELEESA